MEALTKNCGFVKVNRALIREFESIDLDKQSLKLVPLAVPPSTNPVYRNKPGEGVFDQILYDLSLSPDGEGIMAIGALDSGTVGNRDFICAKVRLSTGEEGWINIAMHSHKWTNADTWKMYLKVTKVDKEQNTTEIEDKVETGQEEENTEVLCFRCFTDMKNSDLIHTVQNPCCRLLGINHFYHDECYNLMIKQGLAGKDSTCPCGGYLKMTCDCRTCDIAWLKEGGYCPALPHKRPRSSEK